MPLGFNHSSDFARNWRGEENGLRTSKQVMTSKLDGKNRASTASPTNTFAPVLVLALSAVDSSISVPYKSQAVPFMVLRKPPELHPMSRSAPPDLYREIVFTWSFQRSLAAPSPAATIALW